MLIGQIVLPPDALLLVTAFFLAKILSHGVQRNNIQSLAQALKLSIAPWLTQQPKLLG
jgi:hypothetical protein